MSEQPTRDRDDGSAGPMSPIYQELRMPVEDAASYRDQEVYLVVDEKGWRVVTERPDPREGRAVIPVMSPGKPTPPPAVGLASVGAEPERPVNLLELRDRDGNLIGRADSVFWTPAAVEKFLVPYYASVYGGQAPWKLTDLIGLLGAVRTPLTQVRPPSAATGGSFDMAGDSSDAGEVFAVAHMPKSEYVQVGGDLVVLAHSDEGGPVAVSFSDWVEKKP